MSMSMTIEHAKTITGDLFRLHRKKDGHTTVPADNRDARRLIVMYSIILRGESDSLAVFEEQLERVGKIPRNATLNERSEIIMALIRTLRAALADSPTLPEMERAEELLWNLLKDTMEYGSTRTRR